ncbi:ABC transporter ATP-binding protein [Tenggerimyces flavus]|uniref:ABC transporter ATP-binding protein n=1 Tax=Tenggerimyces flavus TaxID=1708749 RepID=A0ABV7YC54_9ACTN|nr:ABC transporter ATP-binding protein [Tenggerimyces flavus]MBM7789068.1 ABC-type dipeptide/oligopeptide/nickel transport system ATPase component [Tenggerimyces flavus]
MTSPAGPVLDVRDLRVHYRTQGGDVIAVNGVTFSVARGETLGLVGESGSGKSTAAMAVLRLTSPPGRIVGGSVLLNGEDVLALDEPSLRRKRWTEMSLIPQGSMNSLNPVARIVEQFADAIETHEGKQSRATIRSRVLELLALVNLPGRVASLYPHELSGGMKQRVCIAMSIALSPALIIADEPTSALDVVVQRAVAQTLLDVKAKLNSSMILIGHDMALQAQLVDRIAVMYAGNIVEIAPVRELFRNPRHEYTRHLIASIPSIKERKPLVVNVVRTPDLRTPRPSPEMEEVSPGHFVAVSDEDRIEEVARRG